MSSTTEKSENVAALRWERLVGRLLTCRSADGKEGLAFQLDHPQSGQVTMSGGHTLTIAQYAIHGSELIAGQSIAGGFDPTAMEPKFAELITSELKDGTAEPFLFYGRTFVVTRHRAPPSQTAMTLTKQDGDGLHIRHTFRDSLNKRTATITLLCAGAE